jgi:hypothetical protein
MIEPDLSANFLKEEDVAVSLQEESFEPFAVCRPQAITVEGSDSDGH